jgi:anti-anti-sigma factor
MTSRDETRPLATFDLSVDGSRATIAIAGELDLATRAELAAALAEAKAPGIVAVRLDLRGVEFIDAGSIGLVLGARRDLEARGASLRVAAASPPALRVLDVLGLMGLFDGVGDGDGAIPR